MMTKMKIAPSEPTEDQLKAGVSAISNDESLEFRQFIAKNIYKAMLADCQEVDDILKYPVAELYRDKQGKLHISQTFPPDENSFQVFAHPTSMREVARLVINDHVELIMSHGGLPLWKALIESINSIYTEAVAFHEAPQPAIPEGFAVADPNLSDEKTIEIYKDVISHKDREIKELTAMLEAAKKEI